jgi:hypothetical protein
VGQRTVSDTLGRVRRQPPMVGPQVGGRIDAEPILRLQRVAGTRAVSRVLQRRIDTAAKPPLARFQIGTDVSPIVSQTAWAVTFDGVLDDRDIELVRATALSDQGIDSIDDNQRMFIAALLDPQNVQQFHHEFPVGCLSGEIAFPVSSITAANRARIRDFGRAASAEGERLLKAGTASPGGSAARKAALARVIVDAAGAYAATARAVLSLADSSGVGYDDVYRAMIAAASDSTPGDRAFAGAVFVLASRAGMAVAGDVLAGRVKVDEVNPSVLKNLGQKLGQNIQAYYGPSAGRVPGKPDYGFKGDTMYLASTLDVSDVFSQSIIVHELTHAGQDRASSTPRDILRADVEAEAFIGNTAYQLAELDKLTGADRDRALANVAANSAEAELLCLYYNASAVRDPATSTRWTKLADEINHRAAKSLKPADFLDQYGNQLDTQGLRNEATASVRRRYNLGPFSKQTVRFNGLTGESALD